MPPTTATRDATMRAGSRRYCAEADFTVAAWLLASIILAGCASPADRFDALAAEHGLNKEIVPGDPFLHAVYVNGAFAAPPSPRPSALHVYLEGDGTPWIAGRPAADPTPRNPLMLRLMAMDPDPAVYLGRPCYHGLADSAPCSARDWTSGRYSASVVYSMAAALGRVTARGDFPAIVWFGHSGGGALALLLAGRIAETTAVVTIAANIDPDSWAEHHGYGRLGGSLNPLGADILPRRVAQRHYVGGRDQVVPADLVLKAATGANSEVIVIPGYDHACCWQEIWREILSALRQRLLDSQPAGR